MMSIMESKGLIIKEGSHAKLYRGTLKLTEQGTLLAAQITKRAELAVKQASEGLTDEKRAVFYEHDHCESAKNCTGRLILITS